MEDASWFSGLDRKSERIEDAVLSLGVIGMAGTSHLCKDHGTCPHGFRPILYSERPLFQKILLLKDMFSCPCLAAA